MTPDAVQSVTTEARMRTRTGRAWVISKYCRMAMPIPGGRNRPTSRASSSAKARVLSNMTISEVASISAGKKVRMEENAAPLGVAQRVMLEGANEGQSQRSQEADHVFAVKLTARKD